MPRGIPGTFGDARATLRERIKEMEERLKHYDRREKMFGDLKKWMAARKLDPADIWWMLRQMKPTRSKAAPVSTKKPLHPPARQSRAHALNGGFMVDGQLHAAKGDPEFRRRIKEERTKLGLSSEEVGKKIGISGSSVASYEAGRYIPLEEARAKIVKFYKLPEGLGKAATAEMLKTRGGKHVTNGIAAGG